MAQYFYTTIDNDYHWIGTDDTDLIQITLRTLKLNSKVMGYNKDFRNTACMSKCGFNKNDLKVNDYGYMVLKAEVSERED